MRRICICGSGCEAIEEVGEKVGGGRDRDICKVIFLQVEETQSCVLHGIQHVTYWIFLGQFA